jgi:CRISPR/Cas system-associated endonuclease Cas1
MLEADYVPIAALNQYSYCPHRCWRMFCAGEFSENQYRIEGTSLHDRVHSVGEGHREEVYQVRAIWLRSERYGLIGKSDLIEEQGGRIYPVEYKRSHRGEFANDALQVCAQGLCLEEMMGRAIEPIERTEKIDSLRGLEGAGSAAYFGVFGQLIRGSGFGFETRNRRPPLDPVNALLSFGYALLLHDVQSAVNIVGFDPYLGYLHTERYGRPSLALDLMEEFRPLVVDSMVLAAINRRVLVVEDFVTEPISGAVSLTPEGRKKFLRAYEQRKQSEFKHPVMGRKCTYQEAFEIQGRLLGKYLMAETEFYPPLVLK